MTKIFYFSGELWEEQYISGKLDDHEVTFFDTPLNDQPDLSNGEVEVLSVFVKSKVGKDEMDRFPNLKMISTRSTGFDHIDLEEAQKRGIVVSNVPAYGANTVAEFAFTLLLGLSRKLYPAYERVRETGSFSQEGLRGFDLQGKTIGVVGCGRIGYHAIKIAKGFGMNVIAFDVHQDKDLAGELGFEYVEFDDLLARSDVVTLHVPYNEGTHHLINEDNISKMKKGAYLINTSRGAVVSTQALVSALEEGIVAGAGLDVLEEEGTMMGDEIELLFAEHPNEKGMRTVLSNHYFIDHPNVLVTPHNAFNTQEALERIIDTTVDNIKGFASGTPQNVVSK